MQKKNKVFGRDLRLHLEDTKQDSKYSNSSVSASNAFQKNGIRTNRIRTNRGRIYVVKGTGTLTNKPKLALIEFALFGDRTNRGIAVTALCCSTDKNGKAVTVAVTIATASQHYSG